MLKKPDRPLKEVQTRVTITSFERRLCRRPGSWGGSEGAAEAPFDDRDARRRRSDDRDVRGCTSQGGATEPTTQMGLLQRPASRAATASRSVSVSTPIVGSWVST